MSGNAITQYYLHADIVNIMLNTQKTWTNFNLVETKVLTKTYIDSFIVLHLVQRSDTQFGWLEKPTHKVMQRKQHIRKTCSERKSGIKSIPWTDPRERFDKFPPQTLLRNWLLWDLALFPQTNSELLGLHLASSLYFHRIYAYSSGIL